jgi:hypothetical protein
MPFETARAFADPYTQADLPASASDVRGATFDQAVSDLPGYSAIRSIDLSFVRRHTYENNRFSRTEADYFLEERGLKGALDLEDRDYNELELNLLASRKEKELRRMAILARAEGSGSSAAGRFGIALATNFLDPVAVGSAFLPVVGPTRYALMLERAGSALGRAGVRAGVGAAEGAVGAIAIEPLIAGAKVQEGAEYAFADSFLNVAIGTVFGGGLHVAGGALGDALKPKRLTRELEQVEAAHSVAPVMTPEQQAWMTRLTAARQEMAGVHGDITRQANEMIDLELRQLTDVVESPRSKSLADGPAWSKLEDDLTAQRATADDLARRIAADYEPAALRAEIDKLSKDAELVASLRKKYRQREVKLAEQRAALEQTQGAVDAHRAKNAAEQRLEFIRTFRRTEDVEKLLDVLPEEARTRMRERLDAATKEARAILESPQAKAALEKNPPASFTAAQAHPRVREAALRTAVAQAASGEPIEVRPLFDTKSLNEGAHRVTDPDQAPLADPKAVDRADEILAAGETAELAAIEREIADTDTQVRALLDEMGLNAEQAAELPGSARREIEAADAAATEAKQMARAAAQLAACSMRHAA